MTFNKDIVDSSLHVWPLPHSFHSFQEIPKFNKYNILYSKNPLPKMDDFFQEPLRISD